MQKITQTLRLTAVALLVLFCGVALKAQTITANINGTVTDPSGAVIVDATVTATNLDTNVETKTTTDKDGVYNLRFLAIGNYKVTFSAPGFAQQESQPFVLEVNQIAQRNAKMALEGSAQTVSVKEEVAPLLNTENGTIATTLDSRAIANIPLVGRDIRDLTIFQPGAVSTTPQGVGNNISVNGNRAQSNNYSLDGIEMNQNIDYGNNYQANPDAVGQLQMVAVNAPAEYGNVNGGDFVAVLKSGTNQFHGNAFFNLQNYLLNSNSYGNKRVAAGVAPTPRSPFTSDRFGGTIGGPVLHNRLFFFGDYQGYRTHATSSGKVGVPTALERTGDFSELQDPSLMCNSSGKVCSASNPASQLIQLWDPSNNYSPFVGNKGVPINNPVAKYLFAHPNLLPLPNLDPRQTPSNGIAGSNLSTVTHNWTRQNQYDAKIDYVLTQKDHISGRYTFANSLSFTSPTIPINFPTETPNPVHSFVLNEIHTVNSSIVNEFRAGITRQQSLGANTIDTSGVFGTTGNSVLGIGPFAGGLAQVYQGFSAQSQSPPGTSSLTTTRSGSESMGGTANTGTNYSINTFLYSDTLTWLHGKHTYKFGAQIERYQQNNFYPGNDGSLGGFYFTGLFSGNTTPTASTYAGYDNHGYAFADLVMDRVSYTAVGGVSGPVGMRQYRDAYFAQDDWKARPNLTLNLGIRYEYDQPITEVNNKYVSLDPATQQAVIAGTPAAEAYCPGCGRSLVHPYYGGFMPRVGFSWQVQPRLVVRGGYGIQNFMEGTGANLRMTTNPPFQAAYESTASAPSTGSAGTYFREETGFVNPANSAATAGGVFNKWDPNVKPAFISQFSLTMEYQLGNTASFQIGYVGDTGQHLITAGAGNQLTHPCVDKSFITASNPTGYNTNITTAPGICTTIDPAPYQGVAGLGYTGNVRYTASDAMENNNSLQASFRQRAWHGLQYTVNYTWAHAMTNSIGFYGVSGVTGASAYAQNFYDNHAEYGPVGQDVRNNMNWNLVYDLPLGRGRTFGTKMPFVVDELIGGWRVSMTGVEYSGFPLTPGGASSKNFTKGNGGERPNHYRKLKVVGRTQGAWFGTDGSANHACGVDATNVAIDDGVCAYGQPSYGLFGSARPGTERVPGFQQYNASVVKDFTIWHEHAINFRTDALNVFNQSELTNPGSNVFTPSSFGVITGVRSTTRQLQLTVSYHF